MKKTGFEAALYGQDVSSLAITTEIKVRVATQSLPLSSKMLSSTFQLSTLQNFTSEQINAP